MDTDKTEAIQNVVDRVSSYQDGATAGTVEQELRDGLNEIGADLGESDVNKLVAAIEEDAGEVSVEDVLA